MNEKAKELRSLIERAKQIAAELNVTLAIGMHAQELPTAFGPLEVQFEFPTIHSRPETTGLMTSYRFGDGMHLIVRKRDLTADEIRKAIVDDQEREYAMRKANVEFASSKAKEVRHG